MLEAYSLGGMGGVKNVCIFGKILIIVDDHLLRDRA